MEAIAMTDHGNMFGAVEFYQKAKAAGIKPIIGCEVYLAPGKRTDRTQVPRSGRLRRRRKFSFDRARAES